MARRRTRTPEEVAAKLRQDEVLAARSIGATEQTHFRWRAEFGGLEFEQAKRLKELERENVRLRKAIADLALEKVILRRPHREMHGPPLRSKGRVGGADGGFCN